MKEIKAVIFDAFGTICEITEPSDTYQRMIADLVHERYRKEAREIAMTQDMSLGELYQTLTGNVVGHAFHSYERELMNEVGSVRAIEGMPMAILTLKQMGFKLGICSNLAAPYGIPVKVLYGDLVDSVFFSYEMGTYKPKLDMYEQVIAFHKDVYGIDADEILFIGDKDHNDCEGPWVTGMQALTVAEWKAKAGPEAHFCLPVVNYVWSHNQNVRKSQA